MRGDSVAAGYWQRPELTADTFVDGWLRTGDVYQRSADGYYRFVGRNSDMIKAGGIWVSPAEVEAVLLEHEDVLEAAVVGGPQRRRPGGDGGLRGARPGPHRRPGWRSTATAGPAWPPSSGPGRSTSSTSSPKTATGKIQRFALRARLGAAAAGTT